MAITQAIGYGFSCMNQYTLPIAIANISWRYYAIVSGWNVIIIVVMWLLFVETNGKTLEEVDEIFEGALHTEAVDLSKIATLSAEVIDATRVESIINDTKANKPRDEA